ncbi:Crp/Fnr family transcriptional regulator [Chryseobacterium gotjawalense]|uniref:Crp/Fnr family transcriptional regulator n=1 Tax=Chryseobacterium gotjawalense TaxID=3042315 RepID=A0ABY8RET7_9FLAO|nr:MULTISPECIES: Crp/Fnr family transcriptional regulator [unclassified Chryseobacterium]MDQ0477253.1 CRP-like cAMP-binding protein [Chryseobacterium sp. MDT2-18]WHF52485.1 Crp/Fnr family transcriptional regulator [Chryseobacterium sp. wdc7]
MGAYPSFEKNILKYVDLSQDELAAFISCYTLETVEKNRIILKEGEVCEFESYVLEGCFKVFYQDENLREHILYFAVEDWWVLDIGSFVSGKVSRLNIQALEDSVILTVDRAKKEQLYADIPKAEKIFRIMNQKSLASMHLRMISMLHKTAERRYLDFTERYPALDQRIAQHQIAAYLGISHEFLSKVKKRLLRNQQ